MMPCAVERIFIPPGHAGPRQQGKDEPWRGSGDSNETGAASFSGQHGDDPKPPFFL